MTWIKEDKSGNKQTWYSEDEYKQLEKENAELKAENEQLKAECEYRRKAESEEV